MLWIALAGLMLVVPAAPAASSSGLLGHWTFDEARGIQAADSSGSGNNGVLIGDATRVAGHSGSALSFAGGSGRVLVVNQASLEPHLSVTVSAWVKHDGSPGPYSYIVAKGASGCLAASYGLYTGPSGGLQFYVSRKHGTIYGRSADAGPVVWDGNWHLVVGTFDASTIRLFVDGAEVGSPISYPGPLEYLLPDSNDFFVGNYLPLSGDHPGCQTRGFLGLIDDVMIWNRALSTSEVNALMSPQSLGDSPTPNPPSTSTPLTLRAGQLGGRGGSESGTGQRHRLPPAIVHLRLSPSTIAIARNGRFVGYRHRSAPRISYIDTESARSTFIVLRSEPGVRRGTRCVRARVNGAIHRGAHCTAYAPIGRFAHNDRAGRTSFVFDRLPRRRLAPGGYRLEQTPRANGMAGRAVSVQFSVRR